MTLAGCPYQQSRIWVRSIRVLELHFSRSHAIQSGGQRDSSLFAIKAGALFQFNLHQLVIPGGNVCLDVTLNGETGVCVNRPIALHRCVILIVPHADHRARRMTEKNR